MISTLYTRVKKQFMELIFIKYESQIRMNYMISLLVKLIVKILKCFYLKNIFVKTVTSKAYEKNSWFLTLLIFLRLLVKHMSNV